MTIKNKLKKVKLSDIKPYPKNAKIHTPEQIEVIKQSIIKNEYLQPIMVDKNNVIVAGHGRYLALKEIDEKQSIEVVDCSHLNSIEIRKLRILDNTSYSLEWDKEVLNIEAGDIFNGLDDIEKINKELNLSLLPMADDLGEKLPDIQIEGEVKGRTEYIAIVFKKETDYINVKKQLQLPDNRRVIRWEDFIKCNIK